MVLFSAIINLEKKLLLDSFPFIQNEYFGGYKQAYRREDDIAIVNAGMYVQFEDNSNVIKKLSLAYGGMSVITVMPNKTMTAVVGRLVIIICCSKIPICKF